MSTAWRRILTGAVATLIFFAIAVCGYWVAGWDLMDAIYMVIITVFGVGYGEVHPIATPEMKVFTIAVIIVGTSAALYTAGGFLQMITEGEIQRALGERRMSREIDQLKRHTIICGFGRIGQILAAELQQGQQDFVIIDTEPQRILQAQELGYLTLKGNAAEEEILTAAGIDRAATLATVLPDDATNVFITLSARNLNRELSIVASGEHPRTEPKLRQAGADSVVLPASIGAKRIADLIVRPSAIDFLSANDRRLQLNEELEQLGMRMDELVLLADSPLVGKPIGDIGASFLIVGVRRTNGETITRPGKDLALKAGDTLILLGHADELPKFTQRHQLKREISYRGQRTRISS